MNRIALTGAYGFSGKYAAKDLAERGFEIVTLTSRPKPDDAPSYVAETHPLNFEDGGALKDAMKGCCALVNTYWVRYRHRGATHEKAVENSKALIDAAAAASVPRIVHVSILNPSRESPSPYYRGKAEVEGYIQSSGMPYTILRPAVLFGDEDILINNIAYFLRRFPLFVYPGDGSYGIRPVFVEDFAGLIADAVESADSGIIDAVGPESFTFRELVLLIRKTVASRALVLGAPNPLAYFLTSILSLVTGDLVLSRDEITQLTSGVLSNASPAAAQTKLSEWLSAHKASVGLTYHSETKRHFS